ncbi:MAG: hypothetical protein HY559_04620 [Gammaproteobacteria bacterium]|nr:hypothetical protein [Gammaproteobacteria bacterium]
MNKKIIGLGTGVCAGILGVVLSTGATGPLPSTVVKAPDIKTATELCAKQIVGPGATVPHSASGHSTEFTVKQVNKDTWSCVATTEHLEKDLKGKRS